MGDPELVAALNLVIADVERQRREQIADFLAAHWGSSRIFLLLKGTPLKCLGNQGRFS
jgi:hypothetical protein